MSGICEKVEEFGKAIGHRTRYAIVQELTRGPRTVGQILSVVGGSQSSLSQHLKVLKTAQVVSDERCGQEVQYQLNTEYALKLLRSITGNFQGSRQ